MAGYVGAKAKKRQRNTFTFFGLIIIFILMYYILPSLKLTETVPSDNLLPSEDEITSVEINATLEELQLTIFDKQQKIIFRDKQIKKLQEEISILNSKNNEISNSLWEKDNKINLLLNNEKAISKNNQKFEIMEKNNNEEINKLNKLINSIKIEKNNLIKNNIKINNENDFLKKENENIFKENKDYKNLNLEYKNKINTLEKIINDKNLLIKSLKDKTHH